MTRTPTIATLTGLVDLRAPTPETITIRAMAHHLAQLNRYVGALETPFCVAQHSVLVYEIFRRTHPDLPAIHALLHDAPEYVWGDISRPAQVRLDEIIPGFRRILQGEHLRLEQAIYSKWGIPSPSIEIRAAVHEADEIALATEWRALMPKAGNGPCPVSAAPWRITPKPLPWVDAADLFATTLQMELDMGTWRVAA